MKSRQKVLALLCAIFSIVLGVFSCKDATVEEQPVSGPKTAAYKVLHYQQTLPDAGSSEIKYDLVEKDTEVLSGVIGQKTVAAAKSYVGFTAKSFDQLAITADGKTEDFRPRGIAGHLAVVSGNDR